VWPGDGGYVYIPTSSGHEDAGGELDVYQAGVTGSGDPSLAQVAHSSDAFGFGSGSPVITSNGTQSGTALVWIIWSANRNGDGGQLRAYDPVPVNGAPVLRWSASIGSATNYSTPGVGAGKLYVGTRDGHVIAFGSPVTSPLGGSGLTFPRTTVGSSNQATLTITANKDNVNITNIVSSDPSQFSLSDPSPVTLNTGQQLSVPITFKPSHTGLIAGHVTATTSNDGDVSFSLSGTGQDSGPKLQASTPVLSLGGTFVGGHLTSSVVFSNVGSQTLTIQGVDPPSAPFSTSDAPAANTTLAPGNSLTVDISFDPTSAGTYTPDVYEIVLHSTGGDVSVGLSASAGAPGNLQFSSQAIDFGSTALGSTATQSFTITNTGGTTVTIEKSKPPFGGAFAPSTSLPEGMTIPAGQSVSETVTFAPNSAGPATGVWQITGNDETGLHPVQFTGRGATPSATGPSTGPGAGSTGPGSSSTPGTTKTPRAPKLNGSLASSRTLSGLYINYTAMKAGVSRFVLERLAVGRRGTHGCVAATARNRSHATCTLWLVVASFTHRDRVGANKLRLEAYVSPRKLVAGRYRLKSTLLDSAGVRHTFYAYPRIVLPPPPVHARRAVWASLDGLLARLASLL
jgi:iron transport multicopper oxidase